MVRRSSLVCGITLSVSLLAGCTVTVNDKRMFHPGPAQAQSLPTFPDAAVERITIVASDGITLSGVRIVRADADVDILYFGGNTSRADDMVAYVGPVLRDTRANLTMIDYRGYGESGGHPTVDAMKIDGLTTFDYVQALARGRPVIVHGLSLGGFVAAYVAASRPVRGLVLEATAPDAASWARSQVPAVAKPMVHLDIAPDFAQESNVERLTRYTGPLLLIAGSKDSVTPPRFMQQLFDASSSTLKQMVVAKGARHGNALSYRETVAALQKFLVIARLTPPK